MEIRIPMQPTVRPPWSGWPAWNSDDGYRRRRVFLTLEELTDLRKLHDFAGLRGFNSDWRQIPNQGIVYVPKNLRHRFENVGSSGRAASVLTYPTSEGSWRPDRYPMDTSSWRIPDLQHIRLAALPGGAGGAGGGEGRQYSAGGELASSRRWEESARAWAAWAAGALVLAVIVFVIRTVEDCLHRKFYKGRRRRQSEEWPTPNVLATSQRQGNDQDMPSLPRLEDSEGFQSEVNQDSISNDLPPPYSECANAAGSSASDASKYIGLEEPPPPYSACYVAYSNPKDGVPSVHFYNRQRENLFQDTSQTGHSSNAIGTEDNAQPEDSANGTRELVFDNGRVIEIPNQRSGNIQDDRDNICVVNMNGGRQNNPSPRAVTHTVPESSLEV